MHTTSSRIFKWPNRWTRLRPKYFPIENRILYYIVLTKNIHRPGRQTNNELWIHEGIYTINRNHVWLLFKPFAFCVCTFVPLVWCVVESFRHSFDLRHAFDNGPIFVRAPQIWAMIADIVASFDPWQLSSSKMPCDFESGGKWRENEMRKKSGGKKFHCESQTEILCVSNTLSACMQTMKFTCFYLPDWQTVSFRPRMHPPIWHVQSIVVELILELEWRNEIKGTTWFLMCTMDLYMFVVQQATVFVLERIGFSSLIPSSFICTSRAITFARVLT